MKAPHTLTNEQQRYSRGLLLDIFRLLDSNGQNARPVYSMADKSLPKGGMREMVKTIPYDAVRAEIGGTTLTVEVTPDRKGETNDPDALRFACYDLKDFKAWFLGLLQSDGKKLQPPANVHADIVKHFTEFRPSTPQVRPNLKPAPMLFHHKKRRR